MPNTTQLVRGGARDSYPHLEQRIPLRYLSVNKPPGDGGLLPTILGYHQGRIPWGIFFKYRFYQTLKVS